MSKKHAERVAVSVSSAMVQLRKMQALLNGFWQTSELAYGYVLQNSETLSRNPDLPTVDVLGHIESRVWFPNNQGRIKREVSIGSTIKQMRENTIHAYRATLLSFYSAFEAYLESRVTHGRRVGNSWGPFVRSLSVSELKEASCPLPLRVVLCADFCREIRNCLTHVSRPVPKSLSDPEARDLKARFRKQAGAWNEDVSAAVDYAAHQVIGVAADRVDKERLKGKDLPHEFFYMLFTFTNLDNLAFSIEEALQPQSPVPSSEFYVFRQVSDIHRHDLILARDM